jgi:hypothetical protein
VALARARAEATEMALEKEKRSSRILIAALFLNLVQSCFLLLNLFICFGNEEKRRRL